MAAYSGLERAAVLFPRVSGVGVTFFVLSGLLLPLIVLKARRFTLLFTLSSICTMGCFSFLWGPCSHLRHIVSLQRLPFSLLHRHSVAHSLRGCLSAFHSTNANVPHSSNSFLVSLLLVCVPNLTFLAPLCSSMNPHKKPVAFEYTRRQGIIHSSPDTLLISNPKILSKHANFRISTTFLQSIQIKTKKF